MNTPAPPKICAPSPLAANHRCSDACYASAALHRAAPQENVYPKGPSVQFYKMFLDEDVRRQFAEYDALAVIEWDVIVAHDTR